MADWVVISSLATAGGTLILAGATFASVRSANHAARVTERALLANLRPLLVPTRLTDPPEKVGFIDRHWMKVDGQRAVAEVTDGAIYLAFTVRNVGAGMAVLDRWDLQLGNPDPNGLHRDPDSFNRLTRDIYIPPGDVGFWQAAFRDPDEPRFVELQKAIETGDRMIVDLLYEDHEGGQRAISRFSFIPTEDGRFLTAVARHWNLDRDDPR